MVLAPVDGIVQYVLFDTFRYICKFMYPNIAAFADDACQQNFFCRSHFAILVAEMFKAFGEICMFINILQQAKNRDIAIIR